MKFVQKLGKALMLPVACLPICGILMGLGYAMCPSTMQGGDVTGVVQQIGFFLVKAGGALIDHMALLFAIGVGVGMSDDHDGTAGLAALASWLMITNLLSTGVVSVLRTLEEGTIAFIAFSKIENPFIGIIAGIIGAIEVTAVQHRLITGFNPDLGFKGIVVSLLAGNNPIGVVFSGIFFGALKNGGTNMERMTGVPSAISSIVEGAIILVICADFTIRFVRKKKVAAAGKEEK